MKTLTYLKRKFKKKESRRGGILKKTNFVTGFKNIKLAKQLISCFALIGILTSFVGIIALKNMNNTNESSIEIYEKRLLPITYVTGVQKNMLLIRAKHLYMLSEKDAAKISDAVDEIEELKVGYQELITKYKETDLTKAEENYLIELQSSLTSYNQFAMMYEMKLKENKYEEAMSYVVSFNEAWDKVSENIEHLIEINKEEAALLLDNNQTYFEASYFRMILTILVVLSAAIVLGMWVAGLISKPINKLLSASTQIAEGNLDIEIDIQNKSEIGVLSTAFNKMIYNINHALYNINESAEQVASGANQVANSSMLLSQGATEQASAIEQLSSTVEEISKQTKYNATNANLAKNITEKAKVNAEESKKQMNEMLNAMSEINESSMNISKVIKVIEEIAFQTNILALNAAIEAARAGQYGKGFSVVAEEVRNLALRSSNAAKETTDMIEGSVKKVEVGSKIANRTSNALNNIVQDVSKAAKLVGDIALASNEQAIGADQVNRSINQITNVVQTTSSTSEETASASEELSGQAAILKEQVGNFKLKNNKSE